MSRSRTLWTAVAIAAFAAPAQGRLVVTDGPAFPGELSLTAVPFAFSEQEFDLRARLVVTNPADWSTDCPPVYKGSASIAGLIVLDPAPSDRVDCSLEQIAEGARNAKALAWLAGLERGSTFYVIDPVPGFGTNSWFPGDSRYLEGFVAVDVRQRAVTDLVTAARTSIVTVHLTADESVWEVVTEHPLYYLFIAIVVIHCFSVVELALCRWYSFVRADGGIRMSVPQVLLGLELATNCVRVAYVALDPYQATGVFDYPTNVGLFSVQVTLASVTAALFVVYFSGMAASAGLCKFRLALPFYSGLFLFVIVSVFAVDLALGVVALEVLNGAVLLAGKLVITAFLMPFAVAVLSVLSERRVASSMLDSFHSGTVYRLMRRMRQSLMYRVIAFTAGVASPWAVYGPYRRVIVLSVLVMALTASSYVHVDAMRPFSERPPRGPMRLVHDGLYVLIYLCVERRPPESRRVVAKMRDEYAVQRAKEKEAARNAVVAPVDTVGALQAAARGDQPVSTAGARTSGASHRSTDSQGELVSPRRKKGSWLARAVCGPQPGEGATTALPRSDSAASADHWHVRSSRRCRSSHLTSGELSHGDDGDRTVGAAEPMRPRAAIKRPTSIGVVPVDGSLGGAGGGAPVSVAASAGAPPPDHLLLGMCLPAMRSWLAENKVGPSATTHDVQTLVRKMASRTGISICETVRTSAAKGPRGPQADLFPPVGNAHLFIVHAHSRPIAKLLDCLDAFCEMQVVDSRRTFFWVDCFSLRQHCAVEDARHLPSILQSVGRVVLPMDPWDQPRSLTRAWCLYEIATCAKVGLRFQLALTKEDRRTMQRALLLDEDFRKQMDRKMTKIDIRTSHASVEADRRMILDRVRVDYASGAKTSEDALARFNTEVSRAMSASFSALAVQLDNTNLVPDTLLEPRGDARARAGLACGDAVGRDAESGASGAAAGSDSAAHSGPTAIAGSTLKKFAPGL